MVPKIPPRRMVSPGLRLLPAKIPRQVWAWARARVKAKRSQRVKVLKLPQTEPGLSGIPFPASGTHSPEKLL